MALAVRVAGRVKGPNVTVSTTGHQDPSVTLAKESCVPLASVGIQRSQQADHFGSNRLVAIVPLGASASIPATTDYS